nr:anaerobic ribonucleoside-triphosphate reductase activating protein [Clostridium sp. E02]
MKICGLQKTTLLDYPGRVAATIFLGGCNFRCPFCHNSGLLEDNAKALFSQDEILNFLQKRKGILEGVCITGGEPTLNIDLESLICNIRELGYFVKLDTNGSCPEVLKKLVFKKQLDYVAMDIKASKKNYKIASGIQNLNVEKVIESASFLTEQHVPYEFRTTAVKGIHEVQDFKEIGTWLHGSSPYYLQNYEDSDQVLRPGYASFSMEEMNVFFETVKPYLTNAKLRGMDLTGSI